MKNYIIVLVDKDSQENITEYLCSIVPMKGDIIIVDDKIPYEVQSRSYKAVNFTDKIVAIVTPI